MQKIYIEEVKDIYSDTLKEMLIDLFKELGDESFLHMYDSYVRSKKDKGNFVNWIIYNNVGKIGFIIYRIILHRYKPISIGYIDELYVKKEYRRKGISKKAMRLIIRKLKEKDVLRVDLDVMKQNVVAKKFWVSLGFTKVYEHYRKEL